MSLRAPIRLAFGIGVLLFVVAPTGALAQRGRRSAMPRMEIPRAQVRPAEPPPPTDSGSEDSPKPALGNGLSELSQIPPEEREQRLRDDPAFQQLPPAKQKQMLKSLARLNAMSPEQQQHVINRMHDLGKLNPQQRAGLEQIFHQFQTMAPDRRRAFRSAYNNLRELPPDQRQMRMDRPEFQQRFSPDELKSLHQALDLNLPGDVVGSRPSPEFPPGF